jgi:hypothetical protein
MVFSGYSGFLHQLNSPPRYNRNIVESGIKHHKPKKTKLNSNINPQNLHIYNQTQLRLFILEREKQISFLQWFIKFNIGNFFNTISLLG